MYPINLRFHPPVFSPHDGEVKGKVLGYEGRLTSGYFNNITEVATVVTPVEF